MADKTVIVKIEYDVEGSITSVKELTAIIEGERIAQARLKSELEAGKISQNEYSAEVAKSKETANSANTERKNTIKLLASEKGSNDALRAEIKKLTIERDKLNKTTQQGSKDYEAYTKKIKSLQSTLKDTSGSANKAGLSLKRMWEVAGGIGIAALAKKGLGLLKDGVVNLVQSSEVLSERWEVTFSGMKAAVNVFKQGFIDSLEDITDSTDKADKSTGRWYTNLLAGGSAFLTYFKLLSKGNLDLKTMVAVVTASYSDQKTKMIAADEAARKYTLTMQQLEEAEIALIVPRAKALEQLREMQSKTRDTNIPLQERIPLLEEAIRLEKEQGSSDLAHQKERVAALAALKQSFIDLGMQSQWTDAMERGYQQEIANTFNIQTENLAKTRRAEAQLAVMRKELRDEEKQAEKEKQDAFKKNQEAGKKAAEETAEMNRELAEEKKKADEEELIRRGEEIVRLAELKEQEIELEKEKQEQIRELRQQLIDEQYESLQAINDATRGFADERVTIMGDAFAKIATINWAEVDNAREAYLAIGQAAQGLTALIVAGNEAELNDLEAQKQAELKLAGDNTQAKSQIEAKYNKKLAELKRKQFKEEKAMAIVNAAIATSLAIVKALDFAPPMSFIMAGIAGGLGIAQIAMIEAQKQPEITSDTVFAEGGAVIGGRSHAQGGTKFWGEDGSSFEAEKGEAMFVLKKDATAEIAALSMLNESHGGRSWTQGASHLAEGGEVSPVNLEAMVDEAIQRTPIFVQVGAIETGLTDYKKVKSAGVI
jgi:hypothetical protein